MNEPSPGYDVFLSFAPADVVWIHDWLLPRLQHAGLRVFTPDDFDLGVAEAINLERAVSHSKHMLLVLTPAWVADPWRAFEALLIQTPDPAGLLARRVLPLVLKPCELPSRLAMLSAADFIDPTRQEEQLTRVIAAARGQMRLPDVGPSLHRLLGRDIGDSLSKEHAISTAGDYAEGNIDKRQAAFIADATTQGPVVGENTGTVTTTYNYYTQQFTTTDLLGLLDESSRQILQFVLTQVGRITLPPYNISYNHIVRKLDALLGSEAHQLNRTEALLLLVATSFPYLQFALRNEIAALDNSEEIVKYVVRLPGAPSQMPAALIPLASEIILIANARDGFDLNDVAYEECSHQGTRIRLRLLCVVHHLAAILSLETLYSADRTELAGLSPEQQLLVHQWRYVRSVDIIDSQLRLHFHLPLGRTVSYLPLIVTPLRQEIESLLRQYEDVLHTAGIYLRYRNEPAPREDSVQPLTEEEQTELRRWIELRLARAEGQQLRENLLLRQRLRDRLIQANIQVADDHEQRGEREQAANLLVQTVRSLHDEREAFQLARYAHRAGQLYEDIGRPHEAVRCYLMVADSYFNDTLTPELGHEALSRAEALLQTTPDPALEVELHLAVARIHFVTLSDDLATEALSQARTALNAISDASIQIQLSVEIALLEARLALVWEEWQQALACLEQALYTCPPEAKKERFALLSVLLTVMTQCNDERTDDVYQEACGCLNGEEDRHQQGLLSMYYAGSLARRGQLDRAYETYQDTIKTLDDMGSLYEMFVLYQNMAHMLLKHSGRFFRGHDQLDNLRIDLFHRTKSLNRGNMHEQKAFECIVQEKHRDFMRHIRLASYHFWSDAAWFGLKRVNELFARHYTAVDEPQMALFYAIEADDSKLVEKLAGALARRAEPTVLLELVPKLIGFAMISDSQDLIALSLGTLADVVSPDFLSATLEFLSALAQQIAPTAKQEYIRQSAIKALTAFVPQLDAVQTNIIVQFALKFFEEQLSWSIYDASLDLLNACFTQQVCRVDEQFYAPIVRHVKELLHTASLKADAERVLIHAARTAPPEVRTELVMFIQGFPSVMDRVIDLAFLGEPIEKTDMRGAIDSVINATNVVPQIVMEDGKPVTQWAYSGVTPRVFRHIYQIAPAEESIKILDGVLRALINRDNDLTTRSDAAYILGEFSLDFVVNRADEISDYLLLYLEGDSGLAAHVDEVFSSAENRYSNFSMNFGTPVVFQRNCLYALGRLYQHVSPERQTRILDCTVMASRHQYIELRHGAALALYRLESSPPLPSRLFVVLIALLHDQDAMICARACRAAGHLITCGLVHDHLGAVLERIIDLARTSNSTDIRIGAAHVLLQVRDSEYLPPEQLQEVERTLSMLLTDVSYNVRHAAE
jgi:hypothetical protein